MNYLNHKNLVQKIVVLLVGCFLLISKNSIAQNACNFTPGQTINMVVMDNNTSTNFTQHYLITDGAGDIVYSQSSPSFTGIPEGKYFAYSVNFDNTQTAPDLTIGTNISAIGGDCIDLNFVPLGVCDCSNTTGDVTITNTGENQDADFTQVFALLDEDFNIISTQSTTTFTGLTDGIYNIVGVNFDNNQTAPTLTAGTNIYKIGGDCADLSEGGPLGLVVCSPCDLTLTQNDQSACENNSTNTDASDDYFTIDFNATVMNGGAQYQVVLNANADGTGGTVLGTANYGTAITVGDGTNGATGTFVADGATTYNLTVRDATDNTCHEDYVTTPVNSCSTTCDLTLIQNKQSSCVDNGTNTNPSDDYFTIDFNASVINGGTQYEVVLNANPDGTGGTVLGTSNYNTIITVGDGTNGATGTFVADGATTYNLTVRDATDNTCHEDYTTVTIASCSGTCALTIEQTTPSACNDNNTNTDPSDDYFTITVDASVINGGTQYELILNANANGTGGTVLATSNYGTPVTVGDGNIGAIGTFVADGATTYNLTIRDVNSNTCHQDFTTMPVASCSNTCAITVDPNSQSVCMDNGTNTDPADDFFTIDINATAVNGGAQYEVVLNANVNGTGGTVIATSNYGTLVTVGDGTNGATGTFAADGTTTYTITVRDAVDNTCFSNFMTAPVSPCSGTCSLTISQNNQSACQDNGTNTNPADDYFSVTINAEAVNGGTNYEVVLNANADGTGGTVVGTATYNTPIVVGDGTNGATGTFVADGATTYEITVRDAVDNLCHSSFVTTPVNSCSDAQIDYPDFLNPAFPPPCADQACHVIDDDLKLGATVTADPNNMGSANATGDNDDGILFPNDLRVGTNIRIQSIITNNTGSDAYLNAWADWNGDGDFDDVGEMIITETYPAGSFSGMFTVSNQVFIPSDAEQTSGIPMRFRLSSDPAAISSPCSPAGCAPDGEIEDYLIQLECPPVNCVSPVIKVNRN